MEYAAKLGMALDRELLKVELKGILSEVCVTMRMDTVLNRDLELAEVMVTINGGEETFEVVSWFAKTATSRASRLELTLKSRFQNRSYFELPTLLQRKRRTYE
ncbi:hypothetical protein BGZ92_011789 [Podila epicladia]|nr:hypothetical protein BGZ92_011789 [Podila epicladia]